MFLTFWCIIIIAGATLFQKVGSMYDMHRFDLIHISTSCLPHNKPSCDIVAWSCIIFPLISPFMTWHRPGVYWTEFEKTLSNPCCKVWWGMQGSEGSSLASPKKLESHFWPSNRMSGWWRLSCGCTIEYPTGSTNKPTQRPIWAQMLTDSTDPTNPTNIEPRTKTTWC